MAINRPIPEAEGISATNIPSGDEYGDPETLGGGAFRAAQPKHPNRTDVKTEVKKAGLN